MADTATSRYKARKQGLGDNVNTWGDTKLNDVIDTLDRGSKGYESTAITGDLTLSWSNYTTTNPGQVAVYRLTGSLSTTATITVPSAEWNWDAIINQTGQTVTVKTSGGSGVTIPTGYAAAVYCNGSDTAFASPTRFGGNIYAGGQIKNLTNGSANQDAVSKLQMDNAIAAASITGTGNTLKITSSDTTSKYLNSALTTQVSGVLSLSTAVLNSGANEQLSVTGSVTYGALISGGDKSAQFTPASNTSYRVDTTSALITVQVGGMTTPSAGDIIEIAKHGTNGMQMNFDPLKFNGSTVTVTTFAEGISRLIYTGSSRGFVEG